MKLPIGIIARMALKYIVLPAIGKAVASPKVDLTKEEAKDVVVKAVQEAALKQIAKRVS